MKSIVKSLTGMKGLYKDLGIMNVEEYECVEYNTGVKYLSLSVGIENQELSNNDSIKESSIPYLGYPEDEREINQYLFFSKVINGIKKRGSVKILQGKYNGKWKNVDWL